ncbi:MAG: response regulator [Solirubrobacteraceae bacterium]|jgi:DNA-binding NarL/FixJ family response regulator
MDDDITHARHGELPRFIVADDEAFVCGMIASQLAYTFECVGSAADTSGAVALVREHRPDVAILDVVMPGDGVLEATRAIRTASPETAVVILSGDEVRSEVIALLNAGASAYLRKGIGGIDLARGLAAAIAANRHSSCRPAESGAGGPA